MLSQAVVLKHFLKLSDLPLNFNIIFKALGLLAHLAWKNLNSSEYTHPAYLSQYTRCVKEQYAFQWTSAQILFYEVPLLIQQYAD